MTSDFSGIEPEDNPRHGNDKDQWNDELDDNMFGLAHGLERKSKAAIEIFVGKILFTGLDMIIFEIPVGNGEFFGHIRGPLWIRKQNKFILVVFGSDRYPDFMTIKWIIA